MGRKVLLWGGMWKQDRKGKIEEFLGRYLEFAPSIYEFLGPLAAEARIRQRIEAAISDSLYKQSGVIGRFQDDDIRYYRKREDEAPLTITVRGADSILGLDASIEA